MTNEGLNTALYEKMFAEQETFRAVLPVPRMDFPTMWALWRNAKTVLSIPSKAIPAISCFQRK